MSKIKSIGRLALIICLIVCLAVGTFCMGGAAVVHADEPTEQETPVTSEIEGDADKADESEYNGSQSLVDGFLAQLKEKYGDEYETYYNAIIAEWGSIEAYLLSLADDGIIPDVAADGWKAFVHWMGENAPIWAPILALIILIVVIIIFRKKIKLLMSFVKLLFVRPTNKIFKALIAQNQALILLLGNGERSAEAREALTESIEEMQKEEKSDGKI